MVFEKNYSTLNNSDTYLTFQCVLDVSKKLTDYTIPFDQFSIPSWWYKEQNIKKTISFSQKQHQITSINIENCTLIKNDESDEIVIHSLSVQQQTYLPFYLFLIGLLISTSLLLKAIFIKKRTVHVEYSSTTQNNEPSTVVSSIDYIAKNYQNPELSLSEIKQKTGLSESKISEEIKEKTNLSFKQYLNAIRLVEVKSLLSTTELSISEIAYKVGYNNVSHFNRVFKQVENCSPGDFRKNSNS